MFKLANTILVAIGFFSLGLATHVSAAETPPRFLMPVRMAKIQGAVFHKVWSPKAADGQRSYSEQKICSGKGIVPVYDFIHPNGEWVRPIKPAFSCETNIEKLGRVIVDVSGWINMSNQYGDGSAAPAFKSFMASFSLSRPEGDNTPLPPDTSAEASTSIFDLNFSHLILNMFTKQVVDQQGQIDTYSASFRMIDTP